MPPGSDLIDFRNTNSLWASVAVETLARLGLTNGHYLPRLSLYAADICLCPASSD